MILAPSFESAQTFPERFQIVTHAARDDIYVLDCATGTLYRMLSDEADAPYRRLVAVPYQARSDDEPQPLRLEVTFDGTALRAYVDQEGA